MEVILKEDVNKLGQRGDVVKVADGYGRNFLLPKRLAVAATDSNRKIVEQERQALRERMDAAERIHAPEYYAQPECEERHRTDGVGSSAYMATRMLP